MIFVQIYESHQNQYINIFNTLNVISKMSSTNNINFYASLPRDRHVYENQHGYNTYKLFSLIDNTFCYASVPEHQVRNLRAFKCTLQELKISLWYSLSHTDRSIVLKQLPSHHSKLYQQFANARNAILTKIEIDSHNRYNTIYPLPKPKPVKVVIPDMPYKEPPVNYENSPFIVKSKSGLSKLFIPIM